MKSTSGHSTRHAARRHAVQALYQWDLTAQAAGEIESHFISQEGLGEATLAYFRTLIERVPRLRDDLDAALQPYLDRGIASVDPVERAVLRVAAYELLHEPVIPYRSVINEAVELAKTFGADNGYRFVNGVLDKLARAARPDEPRGARSGTRS